MSLCPSDDLLLGLLEERLAGPELAEIVIHVEICPRCQEYLECLTRGQFWRTTAPAVVADRRPAGAAPQSTIQAEGGPTASAVGGAEIEDTIDNVQPVRAGWSTDRAIAEN